MNVIIRTVVCLLVQQTMYFCFYFYLVLVLVVSSLRTLVLVEYMKYFIIYVLPTNF